MKLVIAFILSIYSCQPILASNTPIVYFKDRIIDDQECRLIFDYSNNQENFKSVTCK